VEHQQRPEEATADKPNQHQQMVPDVAEPVPSRQLPDQLYQCPGDESCVQAEATTESLHRTALDSQGYCADAEQHCLPIDIRPRPHFPPHDRVRDEEDSFDRQCTCDGRRTGSSGWGLRATRAPIAAPTM
jgi:hypothetical protein